MRDVQRALKRKCFNSIKGTIKTVLVLTITQPLECFNSIKGTIKTVLQYKYLQQQYEFQFHKRYD